MKQGYTVQYGSSNSILVVNALGRIRQLYTPFRVKVIKAGHNLKEGTFVYVDEVAIDENGNLVYITASGAFLHSQFRIIASF